FWSFFFDRAWHAAVHALFLGALAHLMLQFAVIARPTLPFAAEPQKAQRSATIFMLFLFGGLAAAAFPWVLSLAYESAASTVGLALARAAVTVAVEVALPLRGAEVIGELEFRG